MKFSNLINSAIVFVSEHPKEISAGLALFASVLLSAKSSEQKQPDAIDICLNAATSKEEAIIKTIEVAALKDRNDYYKNNKVDTIVNICKDHPEVVRAGTASIQRIMQSTSNEWYRRCMTSSLMRLL